MKKSMNIVMAILLLIGFTGCEPAGSSPESKPGYCTVTFETSGGSSVQSQSVKKGKCATEPSNPSKTDSAFVCWFKGEELYDFSTPVNSDTVLTAKWYDFQTTVKELPQGTDGTFGTAGKYVLFGDYPQTHKAADVVVDKTKTFERGGITYYAGSDGCLYAEQFERAYWDYYYSDGYKLNLFVNSTSVTGFFKLEPIKWRLCNADFDHDLNPSTQGKKLLVAENSLLCKEYNELIEETINGNKIYACNYQYSKIRGYLNGGTTERTEYEGKGFYNEAFTDSAKALIATSTIENPSKNILYNANTNDKVFILAREETTYDGAKNHEEDFDYNEEGAYKKTTGRVRMHTDYSIANCGAYAALGVNEALDSAKVQTALYQKYGNLANYWTRDPRDDGAYYTSNYCVAINGKCLSLRSCNLWLGVVPALCLE